jgi:hypothetical protein
MRLNMAISIKQISVVRMDKSRDIYMLCSKKGERFKKYSVERQLLLTCSDSRAGMRCGCSPLRLKSIEFGTN